VIEQIYDDHFIVSGVKCPKKEIYELNEPHIFKKDVLGNYIFEDGLICDYQRIEVKLKLL
jgi:hypothetical protein